MEPKLITYKGETKTVSQWARQFNLTVSTIYRRLEMKWQPERILETPHAINIGIPKPITKSDAERFLNDLPIESLPKQFVKPIDQRIRNKFQAIGSHGTWIRKFHRNLFDKWFIEEYAPAQ